MGVNQMEGTTWIKVYNLTRGIGSPILNAKLFGGLAAITFVTGILDSLRILPPANLDFVVGSVSFGPSYWRLFIFLACTFFGFSYFCIARIKQRPLKAATELVGFLLVALASVVWLISSFLMTDGSHWGDRLAILLLAAIGCFILGVVLATANVAWGLLRK